MHHATLSSMLEADDVRPERFRPLKRVEYERLVDLGAFEDERIELLRGALVTMSPQKSPHAHAVGALTRTLIRQLGERALVRPQLPVAISDDSEPEPDIAVVPEARYRDHHPTWAHVIIEVADSSLRKDRGVKRELYAEQGVPEYWIVNVADHVVEVYRSPADGLYRESQQVGPDGHLRLLAFPDVEVAIADLF